MKFKVISTGIAILITTGLASAQFKNAQFGVGVHLGGSKLSGDFENTNAGFTTGFLFRYLPIPRLMLSYSGTFGSMTSGLDAIDTNIFQNTFSAAVFLLQNHHIKPFASLGLSTFHYSVKDENDTPLLRDDGTKVSDWASAFQFGLGLELTAGEHWAVNTVLNYNFAKADELDGVVSGKDDGFFNGLVGVVYYFKKNNLERNDRYAGNHTGNNATLKENKSPAKESKSSVAAQSENPKNKTFSNGVDFEPGSTSLLESSKKQLDKIYEFLINNPEERIELLSSEAIGQIEKKHRQLVVNRAVVIKGYLVEKGIAPGRIIVGSLNEK